MERLLKAQGPAWGGGDYARRMAYARAVTTLTTNRDKHGGGFVGDLSAWHDSFTPLIPLPEHVVQPARQKNNPNQLGYLLPQPPPLSSIIPSAIPSDIPIPIPSPFDKFIPPISISFSIPLPTSLLDPLTSKLDVGIDALRTGSAAVLRQFARSPFNVDPLSPKEVEVNLVYHFKLAIPSLLQLAPGVTDDPPQGLPSGSGRFFKLKHGHYFTARLQSTGGRRTLLGLFPYVPDIFGFSMVPNTPLYWRPREKEEEEEDEDEEEKKKEEEKEKKDKEKNKEGNDGG